MTTLLRRISRALGIGVLLCLAVMAATGFNLIRRDVENLRHINQDNFLWSATQMEVELLRFQRSLAILATDGTEAALDDMRERFDLLWSRVGLMREGRAGRELRRYDKGFDSIAKLARYLKEIDPVLMRLEPDDVGVARRILGEIDPHQQAMKRYTLRVVWGDTAATALVRDRIEQSSRLTGIISVGAVLISVLSMILIMRENVRERMMAAISRRSAEEAEAASRAKSRFLSMMSHEMRNPLNGVLGPLALLEQSEAGPRQQRLIKQAQQSGRSMLGMLTGLLEWGEMQDRRLVLKREPFRPHALAEAIAGAVNGPVESGQPPRLEVRLAPEMPDLVYGDVDRLRQIFVHLAEYVKPPRPRRPASLDLRQQNGHLVGDLAFDNPEGALDWKLELLTGLSEQAVEPFATDALGPLIARGLIAAAHGVLTLGDGVEGRSVLRVSIPADPVRFEKIRVHLETRSSALAAIYQAALRSDRVIFNSDAAAPADLVLVDSTSVGEGPLMTRLRGRFPDALFVSLGLPESPNFFDDVVEAPFDMARLRKSILGRLAS